MIVDLTVENFRSFEDEQIFSLNVEAALERHKGNYTLADRKKLALLRSAAILGANASGKSNLLRSLAAIKWLVESSHGRKDGRPIPPYEPFQLSKKQAELPVKFEVEFVVPSGVRYKYDISYLSNRIVEERLYSFGGRSRALIFERGPADNWETIRFGGTYKGGNRRFPFFDNAAYLSRAGSDASAPAFIKEIFNYFSSFIIVSARGQIMLSKEIDNKDLITAISEIIRLADTGVESISVEFNEKEPDVKLPDDMPEDLKEAIIAQNRTLFKYWISGDEGEMIGFDEESMSEGTVRLREILPLILESFTYGSPLILDEMDAHFHTDIVELILRLFHDDEINTKGAQLIFSTHDTNVMDSNILRRDQIWLVSKDRGRSQIKCLDEYDKADVRHDSPFESYYRDGRLGALPRVSFGSVKDAILKAVNIESIKVDANA